MSFVADYNSVYDRKSHQIRNGIPYSNAKMVHQGKIEHSIAEVCGMDANEELCIRHWVLNFKEGSNNVQNIELSILLVTPIRRNASMISS